MKQLNKQQRHKIYKNVYHCLMKYKNREKDEIFLCLIFDNFIEGYSDWDNQIRLPEFESFLPDGQDIDNAWLSYYYDEKDRTLYELNNNLRETVLLFCIEMIK